MPRIPLLAWIIIGASLAALGCLTFVFRAML